MKRIPITDRMRWQSLVENFGIECWICRGRLTLADRIQFDHYVEVADNGPHTPQNIKPVHYEPCHKIKSAKKEAQRHHIKRLAKGPKKPKGRKLKSRPFPAVHRPMRGR